MKYNLRVHDFGNGRQELVFHNKPINYLSDKEREWVNLMSSLTSDDDDNSNDLDVEQDVKEPKRETDYKKIYRSYIRSINNVYGIARSNRFEYFITITLFSGNVNRFDYDACQKLLSKVLKQIKRFNSEFKYLIIPEQHKNGAWHFHGLCSNLVNLIPVVVGGVNKVDNNGNDVYTISLLENTLGMCSIVKIGQSDLDYEKTSRYVTKYITKDNMKNIPKGKRSFKVSRNCDRPDVTKLYLTHDEINNLFDRVKDMVYDTKLIQCNTLHDIKKMVLYLQLIRKENEK